MIVCILFPRIPIILITDIRISFRPLCRYQAGYNWLLTVYTVKCCINLYTSLLSTCMPKEWKHFFNSLMSLCINVKIIFMYWGSLNFWPVLFICRPCTFTGKLLKEQILQSCWEKYYEFLPFPLHHGLYRSTPSCFLVWDTLTQHCFSENNQIERVKFPPQKVE